MTKSSSGKICKSKEGFRSVLELSFSNGVHSSYKTSNKHFWKLPQLFTSAMTSAMKKDRL